MSHQIIILSLVVTIVSLYLYAQIFLILNFFWVVYKQDTSKENLTNAGLEPTTSRIPYECSTNWANIYIRLLAIIGWHFLLTFLRLGRHATLGRQFTVVLMFFFYPFTTTATNETMTHRLLRVTNFPIGSFHRLRYNKFFHWLSLRPILLSQIAPNRLLGLKQATW